MYTTLLFDLDGTLIDSLADIAQSVNHVRASYGLAPLPLDDVRAAVGGGLPLLLQRTVPIEGDEPRRRYAAHHAEHCLDHTTLYPGVREGLEQLASSVALGVVTNKPQAFTAQILAGLAIAPLFRVVVGGDTSAGRKPDPASVLAALERLGRAPWDCLMVGDGASDIEAGRAAGTATCAVAWGFRPLDLLLEARPDHVVHRFANLIPLLRLRHGQPIAVHDALGRETFFALARAFYRRIDGDPRLRAMFPRDLSAPSEHQALFLIQLFGGPTDYSQLRGHPRLRMRHAPFRIDAAARDAWLENMIAALDEVAVPEPARGIMRRYFAHTATFLINAG